MVRSEPEKPDLRTEKVQRIKDMRRRAEGVHPLAISLPTKKATVGARVTYRGVEFYIERIICKATDQKDTTIVAGRRIDGLSTCVKIRGNGRSAGLYGWRGPGPNQNGEPRDVRVRTTGDGPMNEAPLRGGEEATSTAARSRKYS